MYRIRLVSLGLLLLCSLVVEWKGLLLPPPPWMLKRGPAPTGRTRTIEGVEFVEIGPGVSRMGSDWLARNRRQGASAGDLLGRLVRPMGLDAGEPVAPSDEMPVHWIEIRRPFWISSREITNEQYARCERGYTPPGYEVPRSRVFRILDAGPEDPVRLEWSTAAWYCAWLAKKSGLPVRLPSEAEWEVAARAGGRGQFCFGDDERELGDYAWYRGNSSPRPHEVGTKRPNAWGLYDLHGNVWEWCRDTWHRDYRNAPTDGDAWEEPRPEDLPDWLDSRHTIRGGGWPSDPVDCRSAARQSADDLPAPRIGLGSPQPGFRAAFTLED